MKTLIIIFFLTNGIKLFAQDYTPLLTKNKFWDIVYWQQGGIITESGGERQFISGDTLINGTLYNIISAREFIPPEHSPFVPPFTLSDHSYIVGFMREDIINRKVYTYNNWINSDYLTYDFALGIGDTLILRYLNNDTCVVDKISQVKLENGLIVNSFRFKQHDFIYDGNDTYIEGIGGSASLKFPFEYQFEAGSHMDAVGINDKRILCFACYIIVTSISANIQENAKIEIYPNPVNDKLSLINSTNKKGELKIYNPRGQLLINYNISERQEPNMLDISMLTKGTYLVKFEGVEAAKSFKLIKQ